MSEKQTQIAEYVCMVAKQVRAGCAEVFVYSEEEYKKGVQLGQSTSPRFTLHLDAEGNVARSRDLAVCEVHFSTYL